jgi:hypothetical protein
MSAKSKPKAQAIEAPSVDSACRVVVSASQLEKMLEAALARQSAAHAALSHSHKGKLIALGLLEGLPADADANPVLASLRVSLGRLLVETTGALAAVSDLVRDQDEQVERLQSADVDAEQLLRVQH